MNLNSARVFVRDLAAARRFYGEALGLAMRANDVARGYCLFDAGNVELVVEAVPADAPAEVQTRVGRVTGLSFRVPSMHVAHQDMARRGVVFTAAPQRQFWGGTLATFRDPDGNEFQIVERA